MMINQYLISRNFQQPVEGQRESLDLFKRLLQPHFLFNSLNNLYALSVKQSDQTPEAIAGLSRLLERVVVYAQEDKISLQDEVQLIRDYISLERIWLGECAFLLDLQVKGDLHDVMIPPLTVYTLIENAFKHGVRKCGNNGWITVHLLVKKDKILVKIRNSVLAVSEDEGFGVRSGDGLGIRAVRKLLEDTYHKSYYLEARPIGNIYAVDLIIGREAA